MNEWNYEYERLERLGSAVDLGNGILLDYGNWDLPPVCFQFAYATGSRDFVWCEHDCEQAKPSICQLK